MFVRPAPGLKIRDPLTRTHIPENGIEVVESYFWLRRVRDGDVNVVQSNQAEKRIKRKEKGE